MYELDYTNIYVLIIYSLTMNLYEILGVDKSASKKEIKKAYKNLVKKYHPDKNKDIDTTDKFKEVQTAWEVLSNDKSKEKYDKLSSFEKIQFYDIIKQCFTQFSPKYTNILNDFVNKYYGDEKDLEKNINNLDIKKIYEKILTNFQEKLNEENIIIPIYERNKIDEIIEPNINCTIKCTIDEKYMNKYRKISIKKSDNKKYNFIIPLRLSEYIIKNEGETNINGDNGDIIVKIKCQDLSNYKIINKHDLMIIKTISLYEYLYGGKSSIRLPNNEIYVHNYESCIDRIPIFCIDNMGFPYTHNMNNTINTNNTNSSNNILRGNLFIHYNIDGINNKLNDISDESSKELFDIYHKTIKNMINNLFSSN